MEPAEKKAARPIKGKSTEKYFKLSKHQTIFSYATFYNNMYTLCTDHEDPCTNFDFLEIGYKL